jgi:tetratricopeptide (TPR) repeat protein
MTSNRKQTLNILETPVLSGSGLVFSKSGILVWLELGVAGGLCFSRLISRLPLELLLMANWLILLFQLCRLLLVKQTGFSKIIPVAGIGLILAGSLVAVTNVLSPERGLEVWGRILAGLSLYLAISFALATKQLSLIWLAWLLVFWGVVVAVIGVLSVRWNNKIFDLELYNLLPRLNFIEGISANQVAGTLVIMLPLPFMLAFCSRSWWGRVIALAVGLGFLAVIILTQSRASWFATFACILALLLFILTATLYRQNPGLYRLILNASFSLILLGGLISLLFFKEALLQERLRVWELNRQSAELFPFSGVGLDNFARTVPFFQPYFLEGDGAANEILYRAYTDHVFNIVPHNLFFQVWLDLGLAALIGFCWWLAWLGWRTWLFILNQPFSKATALSYGFIGAAIIFLVRGQADTVFWTNRLDYAAWVILAVLASLPLSFTSKILPKLPKSLIFGLVGGISLLGIGLGVLNWQKIAASWQANQANLALQKAIWYGIELKPEKYLHEPNAFVAEFYDSKNKPVDYNQLAIAVNYYEQAVKLEPVVVSSWRGLALASMWRGDYVSANGAIQEALKLEPSSHYNRFVNGLIAYQAGDTSRMISTWQKTINSELYLVALGFRAWQIEKNDNAAKNFFELSLQVRPTALAYAQLAEIAQFRQDWQACHQFYRSASLLEPDNFLYYRQNGFSLLQLNQKPSAIIALEKAYKLNPNDRVTVELLQEARK